MPHLKDIKKQHEGIKMKFKSEQVEKEFEAAPILLKIISYEFSSISLRMIGQEGIMTRVLEKVVGDSGVHEDYRAVDFRDEFDGGRLYTDDEVKSLCSYMNENFKRNDGKPTMIHHSFNGGPLHFHIQIAISTKTYMPSSQLSDNTDQ